MESGEKKQTLELQNRELLRVDGVLDVLRFDEESVLLSTSFGNLLIEGSSLRVKTLNLEKEIVEVFGRVDTVAYETEPEAENGRRGLFGKLLR